MKKFCAVICLCLISFVAYAYDYSWEYTEAGINYKVYGNRTLEGGFEIPYHVVLVNGNYSGNLVIPDSIEFTYQDELASPSYQPKDKKKKIAVEYIDRLAFSGCSELVSITIPKTVKFIGEVDKNSGVDIYTGNTYCSFEESESLNSIIISDENKTYSVSGNCIVLKNSQTVFSVYKDGNLPLDVTKIGEKAFYKRPITTITIPANITYIDVEAFLNCNGLKEVYCTGNVPPCAFDDSFSENNYENCTLYVKDYAIESFKGVEPWTYFKEIVCDELVTDFNLTYYVDEEVYKQYKHKYGDEITPEPDPTKKGYTFSGWSDIPETMPGKDVNVYGTFSISQLTKDGVVYQVTDAENEYAKVIGNDGASGDVVIEASVEIDGYSYSVTEIADEAFKGNTGITSVTIPASVKTIGSTAFNGCKNVKRIEMGSGIVTIGERAFANIDKLEEVTILAEKVPGTDRTAFENSYIDYVTLKVPFASVALYNAVAPWSGFKEIVALNGEEEEDKNVIKITSAGQTTWCSEYDLDFSGVEGLKAYIATGYDRATGTIWLSRVNQVPAGEGILLVGEEGEYDVPRQNTMTYYMNMMVGTIESTTINETDGEYTNYYLSNGKEGVGFYKVNGSVKLGAHRAYLPIKKNTVANTRYLGIGYDDGVTGMNPIHNSQNDNCVYYNLQGQRVDNPSKGIYIHNGKKVVVK